MNRILDRNVNESAVKQLIENSNWYLLLGISLVALGTLAIIFSFISTIFSVVYLGIFLVIVGFMEIIQSFKLSHWSSFFLHLFLGVLYMVGGLFIALNPVLNALSLTLLLAIFFVVSGVLKLIFSFSKRIPHKGWMVINGLLTLVLGALIWAQWPTSGLWVIGTLVGIDTLFTGWTWIMLAIEAKKFNKEHPVVK